MRDDDRARGVRRDASDGAVRPPRRRQPRTHPARLRERSLVSTQVKWSSSPGDDERNARKGGRFGSRRTLPAALRSRPERWIGTGVGGFLLGLSRAPPHAAGAKMIRMSTAKIAIAHQGFACADINWPNAFRAATAIPNQRASSLPSNGQTPRRRTARQGSSRSSPRVQVAEHVGRIRRRRACGRRWSTSSATTSTSRRGEPGVSTLLRSYPESGERAVLRCTDEPERCPSTG